MVKSVPETECQQILPAICDKIKTRAYNTGEGEAREYGVKGKPEEAVLSQMALECVGLHTFGGDTTDFCHPSDSPDHVVE